MAQLQEKIQIEVSSRELLQKQYESSLENGAVQMNQETKQLQENALVQEISILIANEIVQNTHD